MELGNITHFAPWGAVEYTGWTEGYLCAWARLHLRLNRGEQEGKKSKVERERKRMAFGGGGIDSSDGKDERRARTHGRR